MVWLQWFTYIQFWYSINVIWISKIDIFYHSCNCLLLGDSYLCTRYASIKLSPLQMIVYQKIYIYSNMYFYLYTDLCWTSHCYKAIIWHNCHIFILYECQVSNSQQTCYILTNPRICYILFKQVISVNVLTLSSLKVLQAKYKVEIFRFVNKIKCTCCNECMQEKWEMWLCGSKWCC